MVHQGFNSFSKCSSRFFSKKLKLSSSCNLECNSFYHIIGGGIMSFLIIWVHVSWFTSYQEWDILNPSISPLELPWVIFHLKLFPKECCYLWCSLMNQVLHLCSRWNKFIISLFLSFQSIVSVSGRISPQLWDVLHKPPTSLLFSLLDFQQLCSTLLLNMLFFKLIWGRRCCFLLCSFDSILLSLTKALRCCSLHSSSRIVRTMFFSCLSF